MEIIGLCGYSRSGKDTAADVLVKEYGFTKMAFADKLRELLYISNPLVVANAEYHGMVPVDEYTGPVFLRLKEVIDIYGWEYYKSSPFSDEIRRLIQYTGTEGGRLNLWDDIWVDALWKNAQDDKIVISDCRFPNEAKSIRERGGQLWRVKRSGVGPLNYHPSETSLDDYLVDKVLLNTESLEDFQWMVNQVYEPQL